jgi:site-specific DNA recombinase
MDSLNQSLSISVCLKMRQLKGFITKQVIRAHKEKDQSKEAIKRQITEIEKRLERMEERLINEELTLELFSKHSLKLKQERLDLEKSLIKNQKRVSNLEQCVNIIMDYIANLTSSWALMAYKDKQLLQFLLFPEGIRYSKKNNECRTTKINSVFSYISGLVKDLAQIKMGDIKLLFNIPHLVDFTDKISNQLLKDIDTLASLKRYISEH